MSAISSSTENGVPFQEPLSSIEKEQSKDSSSQSSENKRRVDGEFKVPSPILLKKAKKEGTVASPPLSQRTGKPLSPETIRYAEEMKRKMDAAMKVRHQAELDKIKAIWQKGCEETASKK